MTKILDAHFAASRERLAAAAKVADPYNHKGNKGSIREAFVKELLENCTSKFCSVGAGEIIHRDMTVDEKRDQMDVVLYNNRYPKVPGSGGIDMFFVETVSSTIEVKSRLTKDGIRKAAQASKRIKSYPQAPCQQFNPGRIISKPHPFCFLFAYDVKVSMDTVEDWVAEVSEEDDYGLEELIRTPWEERRFAFHSFLDGIFVLNKGYILTESMPFGRPRTEEEIPAEQVWFLSDYNELEVMWMALTMASEGLHWNMLDVPKYASPHEMCLASLKDE